MVLTIDDNDTPAVEFHADDIEVDSVTGVRSIEVDEPNTRIAEVADFRVRLTTEPTDRVFVQATNPTDDEDVWLTLLTQISRGFVARDYQTWKTFDVFSRADDDTADETATITFSVIQDGDNFDEYEDVEVDDLLIKVIDPDRSAAVVTSDWKSPVTKLTVTRRRHAALPRRAFPCAGERRRI